MVRANDDVQALTGERLAGLLARLHADPEQAGREYERLRQTLIRFFDWRGGGPPDECADECIDRLARRLDEQAPVLDVYRFALGIARLVRLERQRQAMTTPLDLVPELRAVQASAPAAEDAALLDGFDHCLAALPADSRALVLGYYNATTPAEKIANRRRLSTSMGLSENALRSRVQRIRNRLESCIRAGLARKAHAS